MSSTLYGFDFFTRPPSCLLGKESPPRFLSLADRPHYRLPGYASKRSLIGPSACLTIGPALCSAGRPIRSFCLGSAPAFSSLSCAPAFKPRFPPTFSPLATPAFWAARRSPYAFHPSLCRSYRRVPARRAAHSVHTLPPADLSRTQRLVVSQVHSPPFGEVAVSLSCPDVRFTPLFLNDYPARSVPSARRYPCQTNKSFSSPSGLNNVAPFVSGIRAKQTRTSRHPIFLTAPEAFSHTLCASRFAVALQRMKPPLILVLHPNRRSPPMPAFMPDGRAQVAPHAFSHPARFPLVFRVCASVYCGVSVAPACRGLCHHCRARTKVGDRLRVRKTGKIRVFARNRANTQPISGKNTAKSGMSKT